MITHLLLKDNQTDSGQDYWTGKINTLWFNTHLSTTQSLAGKASLKERNTETRILYLLLGKQMHRLTEYGS